MALPPGASDRRLRERNLTRSAERVKRESRNVQCWKLLRFRRGVRRAGLGRSKHRIVREQAMLESQPLVKLYCPRVLRPYMKNGYFVLLADAIGKDGRQEGRVSVAQMIGVRAHRADFRVARKLQPLAGHGDEFAV